MALETIARYVRMEKTVCRSGDWQRASRIAQHVYRCCAMYGYTGNPY